ncbi:MAG TPA: SRPBCC family protein [Bryobacteraceae bacterium]|nr:SRPBCC family protein [Bryobacteraceae bacterium]
MNRPLSVIGGMALGSGLTYFLDHSRGRRRRAVLRDKVASLASHAGDTLRKASRDLSNRGSGAVANVRSALRHSEERPENQVLEARVRSKMGRVVSHPAAIHVFADSGRVTLRGPILADEVDALLRMIRCVDGVQEIDNQLDAHDQARNIPSLQGGSTRPGQVPELWQSNWTPALRVLAAATGGALAAYGLSRRGPAGAVAGALGAGLLVRAVTNMDTTRLIGAGAGRRAVDIQKSLTINAPVEEVFRFWSTYENFPRFMSHIREVRDHGSGRSHWIADGPAGTSVAWDAEITGFEPNRMLAWRSMPGSTIQNAGIVRFEPAGEHGTRVHMQLAYNPPAGAVGHAIAWLFSRDLKTELDEDLVRFKSLIERGKTRSGSGERVTRSELDPSFQPNVP